MTSNKIKQLTLTVFTLLAISAFGQDSTNKRTHFYTGIYNELPSYANYPVIGAVNICSGNQKNVQIGFTNVNQKNLDGVQIGFTNAAGGKVNGSQIGFANVCRDSFSGAGIGFVNLAVNGTDGVQVGFVNLTKGYINGAQIGHVNIATTTAEGAQVGFINVCKDSFSGSQVGFANAVCNKADAVQVGFVNTVADNMEGAQIGFVNITCKKHNGLQLGFINLADSIEDGVPIGFISLIRKGGFMAKEISATEMYPLNLAFKTGINAFYTTFIGSFNPDLKHRFALGAGIGSNIRLNKSFFFNPEALSQFTIERRPQQIISLNTMLGFTFAKRISLLAGPNLVWLHKSNNNDTNSLYEPTTSLYYEKLDSRNSLHAGIKGALRVSF